MTEHLFVYGTLRPGDVRWPLLESFAADDGVDDTVAGTVYDTGRGYPAAIFDGENTIIGRTYRLHDGSLLDAMAALDAEEGSVDGDYHRVPVVTNSGLAAWAYAYGSGLTLTVIPSGDWLTR